MPLNIPGILVPFQLLLNPRLVLPTLAVKGEIYLLRYLDKPLKDHTRKISATWILSHYALQGTAEPFLTRTIVWYVCRTFMSVILSLLDLG